MLTWPTAMSETVRSPVRKPGFPPPGLSSTTWLLLTIVLGLSLVVELAMARGLRRATISYTDFYQDIGAKKITAVTFDGRDLTGRFAAPQVVAGRSVTAFETTLPDVEDPGCSRFCATRASRLRRTTTETRSSCKSWSPSCRGC